MHKSNVLLNKKVRQNKKKVLLFWRKYCRLLNEIDMTNMFYALKIKGFVSILIEVLILNK